MFEDGIVELSGFSSYLNTTKNLVAKKKSTRTTTHKVGKMPRNNDFLGLRALRLCSRIFFADFVSTSFQTWEANFSEPTTDEYHVFNKNCATSCATFSSKKVQENRLHGVFISDTLSLNRGTESMVL